MSTVGPGRMISESCGQGRDRAGKIGITKNNRMQERKWGTL